MNTTYRVRKTDLDGTSRTLLCNFAGRHRVFDISSTTGIARDARLRERARAYALEVGERVLANPNAESRGIAENAGDAILHLALTATTGEKRFEHAMHESIQRAARAPFRGASLFAGTSGLRAAAAIACSLEPRYARLVAQCDAMIDEALPTLPSQPERYTVFDVMDGWAGARLARCVDGPRPADRLSDLLEWLLEDERRWHCPHPVTDPGVPVGDLGIAHGIAGVLASIVLTHDALSAQLRERVRCAAERLKKSAVTGAPFVTWPHSLGRAPDDAYRSAWCYGTPGVACALHAVARALGDSELEAFSIHAALDVASRTPEEWLIDELGLCHGLMGNALCFASLGSAARCDELLDASERLVLLTLDRLEASGGRCYSIRGEHERYDATSEIAGSVGVALALLTLVGDAAPRWMLLHALRPIA